MVTCAHCVIGAVLWEMLGKFQDQRSSETWHSTSCRLISLVKSPRVPCHQASWEATNFPNCDDLLHLRKGKIIRPCAKNKAKGPSPVDSQKTCFSLGPIGEWPGSWHSMDLQTHYAGFLVCKPSLAASPLHALRSPPVLLLIPGHRASRVSSFSREKFKTMGTSPKHCWEHSAGGSHERTESGMCSPRQSRNAKEGTIAFQMDLFLRDEAQKISWRRLQNCTETITLPSDNLRGKYIPWEKELSLLRGHRKLWAAWGGVWRVLSRVMPIHRQKKCPLSAAQVNQGFGNCSEETQF